MIIQFLVAVTEFFIALFSIIMFFIACVLGLIVLDYILDSEIKKGLNDWLGPRVVMKKLRLKVLKIFKKYDGPSRADIAAAPEGAKIATDEEYDREIHELVEQILAESNKENRL